MEEGYCCWGGGGELAGGGEGALSSAQATEKLEWLPPIRATFDD